MQDTHAAVVGHGTVAIDAQRQVAFVRTQGRIYEPVGALPHLDAIVPDRQRFVYRNRTVSVPELGPTDASMLPRTETPSRSTSEPPAQRQ